jgi:hypothetical protein
MIASPATLLVEERSFILILLETYVAKSSLCGLIQTKAPVSTRTLLATVELEKHCGYSVKEMRAHFRSTCTHQSFHVGTRSTTSLSLERYLTMELGSCESRNCDRKQEVVGSLLGSTCRFGSGKPQPSFFICAFGTFSSFCIGRG